MKGTKTGTHLYEWSLDRAAKSGYPVIETGWTGDGWSGGNSGVSLLVTNDVKNTTNRDLIMCHYLIHQADLCTKSLKMTNVVTTATELVSFFRSKGMKDFWSDMEPEFGDAICFTEVPWLSHGRMLKRVQDLKEETELFLDVSGKLFPHLCVSDWMCDLAFCNDITQHTNEMNKNQGGNQLMN